MPRFTGKTYGRKAKPSEASKAFDDAVSDAKVTSAKTASTMKKWGTTSFTSTRGTEDETGRKRKIEEAETDSLFDDPFSFDSDDDGPTRPKRGMGFKVEDEQPGSGKSQRTNANKFKKDENNDEKDTMKQAPTKTYSRGSRIGKTLSKTKHDKSKQLNLDSFASKLGGNSNGNKVFRLTLKGNKMSSDSNVKSVPKKFFTSSQRSTSSTIDTATPSSGKKSELFESASDFEYDSDELANLESGDPEIIFNSPQKRRREEERIKRESLEASDSALESDRLGSSEGSKKNVFDDFFKSTQESTLSSEKDRSFDSNNVTKSEKSHGFVSSQKNPFSDESDGESQTRSQDTGDNFSALFMDTERQLKKSKNEVFADSGGEMDFTEESTPQSENKEFSHLFSGTEKKLDTNIPKQRVFSETENVVTTSKEKPGGKATDDKTVSDLFSGTKKQLGKRTKGVFSDSEDEEEIDVDKETGKSESVVKNSKKEEKKSPGKHSKKASKGRKGKGSKQQSSRLFEDSGSDTDDLSSSAKPSASDTYSFQSKGMSNYGKSASLDTLPSRLFPELKRSGSVESNSSCGTTGSGGQFKRAPSLLPKLQSMDSEREKKGKQPIVRRLLTSPTKQEGKKLKASYNPRSWRTGQADEEPDLQASQGSSQPSGTSSVYDDLDATAPGMKLSKAPDMRRQIRPGATRYDEDVLAVKVHKEHKQLFTVVNHVKQAHECLEHGETQDFNDELVYIMDGLHDQQSLSVRCLSCLNLGTKCMMPSFRMHLRAHGTLDKVFSALHDAYQTPLLALCTSSILYLITRDRFTMDLEKSSLTLMLRLLSVDSQEQSPSKNNALNREYQQLQQKIQAIFDKSNKDTNNGSFKMDLELITTGNLTMESLLCLTSKKAGDWFKEELRILGGLDHIVKTVSDCAEDVNVVMIEPSENSLDQLRKIERCLRVLENVTYLNPDNQNYLVSHKSCQLVQTLYRTLNICENCLTFNPVELVGGKLNKDCVGYVILNTLLAVLRVLLNLTHDNAYTSTKVGQQDGLIKKVLYCLLRLTQYVPSEQRFDLLVLGLGLLINIVEHCDHNRDILIVSSAVCPFDETSPMSKLGGKMDSLEALTKLFTLRYEAAKRIEVEHDEELEERQRLQQERMARASRVNAIEGSGSDAGNKSGEWKHSASGLEWVVLEENEEEKIERELARDSDSDLDVEVLPNASQDEEENFTKALHRAGRHMEDCILAAYVALLLGCTIQGNMDHIDKVRDCLPEGDFEPMIRMLRKFLGFMNFTATTAVSQSSGSKSISRIIEVLEAC